MAEERLKEAPAVKSPFGTTTPLSVVSPPAAAKQEKPVAPARKKASAPRKQRSKSVQESTTTTADVSETAGSEVLAEVQSLLNLTSSTKVSIGANDIPRFWREAVKMFAREVRGMNLGEYIVTVINEDLERRGVKP